MTSWLSKLGQGQLETMVKALQGRIMSSSSVHSRSVLAQEACTANWVLRLLKVKLLQGDSRIAGADVSPVQAWHPAMQQLECGFRVPAVPAVLPSHSVCSHHGG